MYVNVHTLACSVVHIVSLVHLMAKDFRPPQFLSSIHCKFCVHWAMPDSLPLQPKREIFRKVLCGPTTTVLKLSKPMNPACLHTTLASFSLQSPQATPEESVWGEILDTLLMITRAKLSSRLLDVLKKVILYPVYACTYACNGKNSS